VRVAKDDAFASAALEGELGRATQLAPRDRALTTELVYGTLRVLPWLEERIAEHAPRGTRSLDARIRAELGIAAYQLFFLDRIPAFAAVSEAVDAIRKVKGPRVAAFANAVLRKLATDAEKARTEPRDVRLQAATMASLGAPVRAGLERALGAEAGAFVLAGLGTPPIGLCVGEAAQRGTWRDRLAAAAPDATFELGNVSPHAILVRGAGKPHALPGFAEGAWSIQEEGSQLVALSVGAAAGETVLDACAGRGNKSALMARSGARVDAADMHPSKLDALRAELARMGLAPGATFAVDWTVGPGDCTASYDAVLVDAPCSGVGTLRRRPELLVRARKHPRPLGELEAVQRAIATTASERVRPGGRLVYAVCSVLREEAEEIVDALLDARPSLERAPFAGEAARALAGDAPTLRLLPHVHGTDGYFLASFRKKC
jgi:16S rRNA (cytosine967-C5)-methyltransferase